MCIFSNEADVKRFRKYLVNAVLSTDIFDKDLIELRESRWATAFKSPPESAKPLPNDDDDDNNSKSLDEKISKDRRATIIIESIIQASDVSHCMAHWTVYTMWNEKLFREMYSAYKMGRSDNDPSDFWYDGELWFFDNYIIPLAKKLKECGVFGASCSEFLNFAMDNRIEWEHKGLAIVAEMVEEFNQVEKSKSSVKMLGEMVDKKQPEVSCTEPLVPEEASGSIFVTV